MESVQAELAPLVQQLSQGSTAALAELYRGFSPLVSAYVRRFVSLDDTDDVVQRVFYEVWRSRERYDPNQSFRAWLLGIARKRAIDQLRRHRESVVSLDAIRDLSGDDGREFTDRMVWADEVRSALQKLPHVQREAIELAYYDGYSQSEIAALLQTPLGTVKTRTARGLQRLAALLEGMAIEGLEAT